MSADLEAQLWWARGQEVAARGVAWGVAEICPEHLRPMGKTDWPSAPACGCKPSAETAEDLAAHGLQSLEELFEGPVSTYAERLD